MDFLKTKNKKCLSQYQYLDTLDITSDAREKFKLLSYLKYNNKSIKLYVEGEYWKILFIDNGIAKVPMKVLYYDETFENIVNIETLDLNFYMQIVDINKEVDE